MWITVLYLHTKTYILKFICAYILKTYTIVFQLYDAFEEYRPVILYNVVSLSLSDVFRLSILTCRNAALSSNVGRHMLSVCLIISNADFDHLIEGVTARFFHHKVYFCILWYFETTHSRCFLSYFHRPVLASIDEYGL